MSPPFSDDYVQHLLTFGFDKPAHIRYLKWLENVARLDLGTSYAYEEPVWDVIVSKFPISLFFGFTSFFLSYLICIPLGMLKAVRNNSRFDTITSVIIFVGYVMPGYALGILLITFQKGKAAQNCPRQFPIWGTSQGNSPRQGK